MRIKKIQTLVLFLLLSNYTTLLPAAFAKNLGRSAFNFSNMLNWPIEKAITAPITFIKNHTLATSVILICCALPLEKPALSLLLGERKYADLSHNINDAITRYLLNSRFDILVRQGLARRAEELHVTPEFAAIHDGFIRGLQVVVDQYNINDQWYADIGRKTLLSEAAHQGKPDVVQWLLQRGADPEILCHYAQKAIDKAEAAGHTGIVRILMRHQMRRERVPDNDIMLDIFMRARQLHCPPLFAAAHDGNIEGLKILVTKDNINQQNELQVTLLSEATSQGHAETVQWLLERGADPEILCHNGQKAIDFAEVADHKDIVQILMRHKMRQQGVPYNAVTLDIFMRARQLHCSPLFAAAHDGNIEALRFLVTRNNINQQYEQRVTLLSVAASQRHTEAVQWLLEHGANPDISDHRDQRAIDKAEAAGHADIVRIIIRHQMRQQGANPDNSILFDLYKRASQLHCSSFFVAAHDGNIEGLKILVNKGNVNQRNELGITLLAEAASQGHAGAVQWLLDHGANPDIFDYRGQQAIDIAEATKHEDIVLILVRHEIHQQGVADNSILIALYKRARQLHCSPIFAAAYDGNIEGLRFLVTRNNINQQYEQRVTLLSVAASQGHAETVQWLLEHGANPDIYDHRGQRAIDRAEEARHENIVRILVRHEMLRQRVPDNDVMLDIFISARQLRCSPIFAAAHDGTIEGLKILATKDNVNQQNEQGATLLSVASSQGHAETVQWLLDHGANPLIEDYRGLQAINKAEAARHVDIVRILVRHEMLRQRIPDNDIMLDIFMSARQLRCTPIFAAAHDGNIEGLKILVTKDNVNQQNEQGVTLLSVASSQGHADAVQWLLDHAANQDISDYRGQRAIDRAEAKRHVDIVRILVRHEMLQQGVNPDAKGIYDLFVKARDLHLPPIFIAARDGNIEGLQILITKDNVNQQNLGVTLLSEAASQGHTGAVQWLLDHGANPDISDYRGQRAIDRTEAVGHVDIVRILIRHEMLRQRVPDNDVTLDIFMRARQLRCTPIFAAAHDGNIEGLKILATKDNVNQQNEQGTTLLSEAASQGHAETVQWLLEHGADPSIADRKGDRAIDHADKAALTRIIQILTTHELRRHDIQEVKRLEDSAPEAEPVVPITAVEQHAGRCGVCWDDAPHIITIHCQHQYCRGCLNAMLSKAIEAKKSETLVCPTPQCKEAGTHTHLTIEDIVLFATPQRINVFAEIKDEEAFLAAGIKHCPTEGCPVKFQAEGPTLRTCEICSRRYCTQCFINHPRNQTCEVARELRTMPLEEKAFLEWIAEQNKEKMTVRTCPKCTRIIERTEGCNHMTCKKESGGCGHEFCLICGNQWDNGLTCKYYECRRQPRRVTSAPQAAATTQQLSGVFGLDFTQ